MGRMSKREKKARLKDTVLDYARGGMKIKEICERTFLHRNTVRAWIKEGCVEKKKVPVKADKPLNEQELLADVEARLSPEQRRREAEFKAAMEALTRLRRKHFPEIGEGYTCDPDF